MRAAHAASVFKDFQSGITGTATTAGIKTTQNNVGAIAGSIIFQVLGLLGIVLVVYIIYAGFLWMTAQGVEENVKKAKAIIKNCVIGLVLVFASYAIVGIVVGVLARTQTGP